MFKKSAQLIALGLLFTACSASDSDESSTGSGPSVKLELSSSESAALRLADGDSLQVSDSISLSYAKLNIAKIKVKAAKERSEEDKTIDEQENEEEKAAVDNLDVVTDGESLVAALKDKEDGDAGMSGGKGKGGKESKDDRQSKLKDKRDELKKDEEDRIKDESKRDKATKFEGPYVFDAIAGAIEGDNPIASVTEGSYRRIQFQLKRNFAIEESEPLFGNVFAIRGTFTQGGTAVPFEIDWHVALNFRMIGDKSLDVETAGDKTLVIDFQVAKWFDGIDLSSATKDADGTIYINRDSNREILHAIHKNIKVNSAFGKDKNGDKKLSEDEQAGQGEDTEDAEID